MNDILHSLTLEEKILQTKVALMKRDQPLTEPVGAAFFFGQIITEAEEAGLDELRDKVRAVNDLCRIPPLITSDFENGCGSMVKGLTPLPYLMGLGATADADLAYDYGAATALEARSIGANWSFSPVCDLNINRRNPLVNVRALTDDADLACRLLARVIRGMQDHGLAACAKHFPGDGVDGRDQHIVTTDNTLPFDRWKETSGRVFREMIAAGVDTIMAGHITLASYEKERDAEFGMPYPATLSRELITDLLKGEMGFGGVVVTDALGMGGIGGWYPTPEQTEIEAFKAGCDMVLWPTDRYVDNMKEAIRTGEIPMERLDDAVSRILALKEKLGLLDPEHTPCRPLSEEEKAFVEQTRLRVSERSVTLVRNRGGLLPIDREKVRRILVVPVTDHPPAMALCDRLCEEIRARGVEVVCKPDIASWELPRRIEESDLVLYALFSRPFRPIGFLDFYDKAADRLIPALTHGRDKTVGVSFGSPYFFRQYFARSRAFVNAYSMLETSVEAFVKAAFGEAPFGTFSPVEL